MKKIAEAIRKGLILPVKPIVPEEAGAHFGWFAGFAFIDCPASSKKTQELLSWHPQHSTLLADLENRFSLMPENILRLPAFSLVVLIGASGSGKSTFVRKLFKPTEIISSDTCRGLVSDDETSQAATADAFALVKTIARMRLKTDCLR